MMHEWSSGLSLSLTDWDIVVFYGGSSPERSVSLESGAAVIEALRSKGHHVIAADPRDVTVDQMAWPARPVVLNVLHGAYGEDGQLQRELERRNIPYAGSDAESSRRTFMKSEAKTALLQHNLSTPLFRKLDTHSRPDEILQAALEVGFPLFIKPDAQGSSLGVTRVDSEDQSLEGWSAASELGGWVLLEQAIVGEEWTVPLLDDLPLPPIRISSSHQFFDFNAKYEDDSTSYEVIPRHQDPVAEHVTRLSQQACRVLGTAGVVRVDVMVDRAGQGWVLEVNTSPGMTSHSLVPKSAASLGWDLAELCERNLFSVLSRLGNR